MTEENKTPDYGIRIIESEVPTIKFTNCRSFSKNVLTLEESIKKNRKILQDYCARNSILLSKES